MPFRTQGILTKTCYILSDLDQNRRLVDRILTKETLMATLGACFGVLAMLLASVGIYGLTSHSVAMRKREIGIRVALGATRTDIVGMVCRNVSVLTACGIGLGLAASLLSGRVLSSLLFGVAPGDGAVLVFVLLTTAAASAVAAFMPSIRAASVDSSADASIRVADLAGLLVERPQAASYQVAFGTGSACRLNPVAPPLSLALIGSASAETRQAKPRSPGRGTFDKETCRSRWRVKADALPMEPVLISL